MSDAFELLVELGEMKSLAKHKPLMKQLKPHFQRVAKTSTDFIGELEYLITCRRDLLPKSAVDATAVINDITVLKTLLSKQRQLFETMLAATDEKKSDIDQGQTTLDDLDKPASDDDEGTDDEDEV